MRKISNPERAHTNLPAPSLFPSSANTPLAADTPAAVTSTAGVSGPKNSLSGEASGAPSSAGRSTDRSNATALSAESLERKADALFRVCVCVCEGGSEL